MTEAQPMTAFLFPGQGSQAVGMGADFAREFPTAAQVFEQADDLLGFKLSALCFAGPADALDDTINTQPALYVSSIAMWRVLQQEYPQITPSYLAGHSLGEFTALTAAGALDFADGVRLVRERGRLMKAAGEAAPGAMAALLGVDLAAAEKITEAARNETSKPLVVANDNCPGQIVISGDVAALDYALGIASDHGARKAVRLAVSIAAHSPLMAPAADAFQALLTETTLQVPQTPVMANATAQPMPDVDVMRAALARQLTSAVRWNESLQAMRAAGVTRFIEIGSGDVLTGMVKRVDRKAGRVAVNTVDALRGLAS